MTNTTWTSLQSSLPDFYTRIDSFLCELDISDSVKHLSIDHAGLRFGDKSDVDRLREELSHHGHCFSAEIVNGREILLFQLNEPLQFGHWNIHSIELPYPKPGHDYEDGWEHIEFVIPSDADSLDQIRKNFLEAFPSLTIEYLQNTYRYSEDMPLAESDQLPNPTIAIRKDKNLCIKFHPKSIQEVVGFVK